MLPIGSRGSWEHPSQTLWHSPWPGIYNLFSNSARRYQQDCAMSVRSNVVTTQRRALSSLTCTLPHDKKQGADAYSPALISQWGGSYVLAGIWLSPERLCCSYWVQKCHCNRCTVLVCKKSVLFSHSEVTSDALIRVHLYLRVCFLHHLCVRNAGHISICWPFCAWPSSLLLSRSFLRFCGKAVIFFIVLPISPWKTRWNGGHLGLRPEVDNE